MTTQPESTALLERDPRHPSFLFLFACALAGAAFCGFVIVVGWYDAFRWSMLLCGIAGLVAFIVFSALVIVMERDS